jgi:thiol:disulfide interchange protein DsbD
MMSVLLLAAALLMPQGLPGKSDKAVIKITGVRPDKAEVKTGETFKVAFDVEIPAGWHIYPTTKTTTGLPTTFEFQGAEVAGNIEEPKARVHPAPAPGLEPYDYHDGKIAISVPLRLKGAAAGPFEVKGKITYMICTEEACLPPQSAPFAFAVKVLEGAPEPAKNDEAPPVKVLSIKPAKSEVKVGEVFSVAIEVDIPAGWHIYPTYKNASAAGLPTEFKFPAAAPGGKPAEPKAKVHPAKGEEAAYDYHDGRVTFTVPLYLKPGPAPGPFEVKGQMDYLICQFEGTCVNADIPVSFPVTVLEGQAVPPAAPGGASGAAGESFLVMLGFAFLGGLILNVMPCVLPVLTLKLFSLVKQKDATAGSRRAAGIAYTAGVMLCLNGLAVPVIVLRLLGKQFAWGSQFQEPAFVIALATLIFVFALSLLGVFQVPAMATGAAAQAGRHHGWVGHLLTGLFVTLVATPCSAPFLGTGLGFALTLPPLGILLFFSAAGFGLALPFLVIGFAPALLRLLPKPGPWMEVFERLMGFTFMAVAVWLLSTLATLTGGRGVVGLLAFLTAVSLGAWIFGKWGSDIATGRARFASLAVAVLLSVGAGKMFLVTEIAPANAAASTGLKTEGLDFARHIPWQPFNDENVAAVRSAKKPGFIDFTADW